MTKIVELLVIVHYGHILSPRHPTYYNIRSIKNINDRDAV